LLPRPALLAPMRRGGMSEYTPYFSVEACGFRIGLVSCLRCGAAVIVGDKDFDAQAAHDAWHDALPARAAQPQGEEE
jgi:hypothetical protein